MTVCRAQPVWTQGKGFWKCADNIEVMRNKGGIYLGNSYVS